MVAMTSAPLTSPMGRSAKIMLASYFIGNSSLKNAVPQAAPGCGWSCVRAPSVAARSRDRNRSGRSRSVSLTKRSSIERRRPPMTGGGVAVAAAHQHHRALPGLGPIRAAHRGRERRGTSGLGQLVELGPHRSLRVADRRRRRRSDSDRRARVPRSNAIAPTRRVPSESAAMPLDRHIDRAGPPRAPPPCTGRSPAPPPPRERPLGTTTRSPRSGPRRRR